jgi:hypothetical protein
MSCPRLTRNPKHHRERGASPARSRPRGVRLARLLAGLVSLLGCARAGRVSEVETALTKPAMEARASGLQYHARPRAGLAWLPPGARYLVSIQADEDLSLEVLDARGRRLARLDLSAALERMPEGTVAEIALIFVDLDGELAQVAAWSRAGSITGALQLGRRVSSWRVGLGADGSLEGQRWPRRVREAGLVRLHRTHALLDDLDDLAEALGRCELRERLALAELAVELGARAWLGEGRARLPEVAEFAPADCRR